MLFARAFLLGFISDGPLGKPVIIPANKSAHENEEITFICNADGLDDSNSKCNLYFWNKVNDSTFRKVDGNDKLIILMKEKFEGKYQCYCENDYGSSEVSDPAELIFLNSSSASKFNLELLFIYV